jgi:ribosomal protein S12 methylthiotransferase accessory factor
VRRGDGLGPLGIGAASAPSAGIALRKALVEAFSVYGWARALREQRGVRQFRADFADVRSFADHVTVYAADDGPARAGFLTASRKRRALEDVPPLEGETSHERIAALVARLGRVAAGAYAVDVTSPDIRAAGLAVAKVVAPELCALDVPHDARFLGGARLYWAAYELGLRARPLGWHEVNADPHPFP